MGKKAANKRSLTGPQPSQNWRAIERTAAAAAATTISEFPVDIISDILLRLCDIKSIIRCMRVCKTWRNLILQLYFAQSQLSSGSLSRSLIFHRRSKGPLNTLEFGILELDDPACLRRCNAIMKFRSDILFPNKNVRVQGACNGLICLDVDVGIVVCNPILQGQQQFFLPQGTVKTVAVGFGYSSLSDKYKVLRCVRSNPFWNNIGFEICTLGSDDTWRNLPRHNGQLLPDTYFYDQDYVFVKEALYWVCEKVDSKLLGCFDVESEEFKIFPLPSQIKGSELKLGVDNCLCLTEWCSTNRFNVWVMSDNQDMESWTLKCTVEVSNPQRLYLWSPIQLVKTWEDGTMLMIFHDETLGFYNPQTGVLEKVKRRGVRLWSAEMTYTPSFVSPPWML